MNVRNPGLLVSVRNADEAEAAWAGGATLIDVKEPALGSLGRASDSVIDGVLARVGRFVPVSAALGELWDDHASSIPRGLRFVKWGLAKHGRDPYWRARLLELQGRTEAQVVWVAYADWQCAEAPNVDDVVKVACQRPGSVVLIDTCCKTTGAIQASPPTLLDWLGVRELHDICERCRDHRVHIALAGSLGLPEIHELRPLNPDWFAVRGAVCEGGREGTIQTVKVRAISDFLQRSANVG